MKIDLRVATITAAERVPKTDKLMKLEAGSAKKNVPSFPGSRSIILPKS